VTRHRFDPFSFIAGGIAVSVAIAVLVGEVSIGLLDLRIAGPVLILLLGLALLLGGGRDRSAAEEAEHAPGPDVDAGAPDAGVPTDARGHEEDQQTR
jgi:hypothetical protein